MKSNNCDTYSTLHNYGSVTDQHVYIKAPTPVALAPSIQHNLGLFPNNSLYYYNQTQKRDTPVSDLSDTSITYSTMDKMSTSTPNSHYQETVFW